MFVTPKENPILASLNSYYVNIERLIEHFQGEVGCGGQPRDRHHQRPE